MPEFLGLILSIVYDRAWAGTDLEPGVRFRPELFPIIGAVFHPEHPLVQIRFNPCMGFTDLIPLQVEGVVSVIVPLSIGGMSSVGHVRDCIYDKAGDQCAVWIGADHLFIDNLLGSQDHPAGSEGGLFLFANDAPAAGPASP